MESAEIATYCADAENCGFYLSPFARARELFHADNETRALPKAVLVHSRTGIESYLALAFLRNFARIGDDQSETV